MLVVAMMCVANGMAWMNDESVPFVVRILLSLVSLTCAYVTTRIATERD